MEETIKEYKLFMKKPPGKHPLGRDRGQKL
jgi:hypothetical protein